MKDDGGTGKLAAKACRGFIYHETRDAAGLIQLRFTQIAAKARTRLVILSSTSSKQQL